MSGFDSTRPNPCITTYALGHDTILFLEHTGQLLWLNPTAALVWKGLESGLTLDDVAGVLASISGSSTNEIRRDMLQSQHKASGGWRIRLAHFAPGSKNSAQCCSSRTGAL